MSVPRVAAVLLAFITVFSGNVLLPSSTGQAFAVVSCGEELYPAPPPPPGEIVKSCQRNAQALPGVPAVPLPTITVPVSGCWGGANTLAQSVVDQAGLLTSASWVHFSNMATCAGSQPAAVSNAAITPAFGAPTGPDFGIMTSGCAEFADSPNVEPGKTCDWQDSYNGGHDVLVLRLDLNIPLAHDSLSFDYQFLTEEYPENVATVFDDHVVAELDCHSWFHSFPAGLSAPCAFAVLSVNGAALSAPPASGSTYDGATAAGTAALGNTACVNGPHTVYISVFDVSDRWFDSAVFLDNMHTFDDPAIACPLPPPPVVCNGYANAVLDYPAWFSATSGTPPYSWTSTGTTPSGSGSNFATVFTVPGTHSVTVMDAAGSSDTCIVNVAEGQAACGIGHAPAVWAWSAMYIFVGQFDADWQNIGLPHAKGSCPVYGSNNILKFDPLSGDVTAVAYSGTHAGMKPVAMPNVGKIALIGGGSGILPASPTSTISVFNPSSNTVTAGPLIPNMNSDPPAFYAGGRVHILGYTHESGPPGSGVDYYFTRVFEYNPVTNTVVQRNVAGLPWYASNSGWTGPPIGWKGQAFYDYNTGFGYFLVDGAVFKYAPGSGSAIQVGATAPGGYWAPGYFDGTAYVMPLHPANPTIPAGGGCCHGSLYSFNPTTLAVTDHGIRFRCSGITGSGPLGNPRPAMEGCRMGSLAWTNSHLFVAGGEGGAGRSNDPLIWTLTGDHLTPPTDLRVCPGVGGSSGTSTVLRWEPPITPGNRELLHYNIYRGSSPTTMAYLATVPITTLQYADLGNSPGSTVYYAVTALSDVHSSAFSNVVQMQVLPVGGLVPPGGGIGQCT